MRSTAPTGTTPGASGRAAVASTSLRSTRSRSSHGPSPRRRRAGTGYAPCRSSGRSPLSPSTADSRLPRALPLCEPLEEPVRRLREHAFLREQAHDDKPRFYHIEEIPGVDNKALFADQHLYPIILIACPRHLQDGVP